MLGVFGSVVERDSRICSQYCGISETPAFNDGIAELLKGRRKSPLDLLTAGRVGMCGILHRFQLAGLQIIFQSPPARLEFEKPKEGETNMHETLEAEDKRHETLEAIRSRALALIQFTRQMEDESLDSAQREREMHMARAHEKGLGESVEDFLMVAQPEWYKLSPLEQSDAIKNAFNEERRISASIRRGEQRGRVK